MNETYPVPDSLQQFFRAHPKAALAFSGGTDSAYLLWAAQKCGCDIKPFFIKTAFQPEFELYDAARLADLLDLPLTVIELDVLTDPVIASNPSDRCYYCKRYLFEQLKKRADRCGYGTILDGTNASDDVNDRPGMKALEELHIVSPLRLCGITKYQVREYSNEAGLFTAKKPSYACLATRIPAGHRITSSDLSKIEQSEQILHDMGFTDFRIRLFHGCARIQLPKSSFQKALDQREQILLALKSSFEGVFLDLESRKSE